MKNKILIFNKLIWNKKIKDLNKFLILKWSVLKKKFIFFFGYKFYFNQKKFIKKIFTDITKKCLIYLNI